MTTNINFPQHANQQAKEYKISKGAAIAIYVLGPPLIALFVMILLSPLTSVFNGKMPAAAYAFLAPLSLVMITVVVIGMLDARKAKFIITGDRFISTSTLTKRELLFSEVKGYRIAEKFSFIEPVSPEKKRIKISKYFARTGEIEAFLREHFNDLNVLNEAEEKEEILNNDEYGLTTEQRAARLQTAKRIAIVMNATAIALAATLFFFHNPYMVVASIAMPLIDILVVRYFKGLIRVNEKKGSAHPTVFWAIFASSMSLVITALIDYNVYDHSSVWQPAGFITLLFMAGLLINNKEFKSGRDYVTVIAFAVLAFGYAYGSIINVNGVFDNSEPEVYQASILNKREIHGKSTTYYFNLSPWGPQTEAGEITVTKALYRRLHVDESVHVYFKKGRLNIPWIVVTE